VSFGCQFSTFGPRISHAFTHIHVFGVTDWLKAEDLIMALGDRHSLAVAIFSELSIAEKQSIMVDDDAQRGGEAQGSAA
jgi:hypothetical protein